MTAEPHEPLQRFHQALVRELTRRREWDLSAPLTVAEIYRDLVPPPVQSMESGGKRNGEYNYLLLRLLAGEGDYLRVESEAVSEEIRRELGSTNPDTELYRDFARVRVHLNPDRLEQSDFHSSLPA